MSLMRLAQLRQSCPLFRGKRVLQVAQPSQTAVDTITLLPALNGAL
jgi:hypothetical protein